MAESQQLQIVRSIPGRVRRKVAGSYRTPEEMQRITATLNARPEVTDVRVNIRTGGSLVHYNRERGGLNHLRARLVRIGVTLAEPPSVQVPPSSGGRLKAVVTFLNEMEAPGVRGARRSFRHTRLQLPARRDDARTPHTATPASGYRRTTRSKTGR